MKNVFFGLILIFLFLGCVQAPQPVQNTPNEMVPEKNIPVLLSTVCFDSGKCISVETADTPVQRSQGLMYRTALDDNAGMVFVFEDEGTHTFWMKNTLIPLDMIWVNAQNEIVDIQTAVPCESESCTIYTPAAPATYVIEINAGLSQTWNVEKGQSVVFDLN